MILKQILIRFHNRYVYAIIIFFTIILFVDQFNLFKQIDLKKELKDKKEQIEFFEKENAANIDLLYRLENDTATMEQVARENYMMKRDNEVIYLIETQE